MTQELINHINNNLSPKYQLVIGNLSKQYVDVPQNITKSTKYVALYKIGDDEAYDDWYYNEFNVETLENWCYRNSFVDRDNPFGYEFKEISQIVSKSLKNYIN